MRKDLVKKILVVLLSICVLVAVALLDPNVENISEALEQVTRGWLLLAAVSAICVYLFDMLLYQRICSLMHYRQSFRESVITTMIGFFYSALTPFQSGGQPMQVIQMHTRGIPIGTATSVLTVKFLAWQLGVTVLATIGLAALWETVVTATAGEKVFFIIGYVINAAILIIAFFVLLRPSLILRAGHAILRFLHRHKIIRKPERFEKASASWDNTINDYKKAIDFARSHKRGMLSVLLLGCLEAFCYMLVTYFIYRAFSLNDFTLIHVVLLQSLLTVAVSFIPLPGASIASEGGFYVVFKELFTAVTRFPAMLLWRLFTYYFNIIFGLIAVIVDGFSKSKHASAVKGEEGA